MSDLLRVVATRNGSRYDIEVDGELDLSTEPLLAAELERADQSDAETIVIDLGGVRFIDSTGIKLLVLAANRYRDRGRLQLRRGSEAIQHVLRVAEIESELPFIDE